MLPHERREQKGGTLVEKIGRTAMLEQLAEEACELGQAALKTARILRGENPTPVTYEAAIYNLREEYTDVIQCGRELLLKPDERQIHAKERRFEKRWAGQNDL